jgi:hypothetical protein
MFVNYIHANASTTSVGSAIASFNAGQIPASDFSVTTRRREP